MKTDYDPNGVGRYYSRLAIAAFATVWAPFVPETLFAVALYRFLRTQIYLTRNWTVSTRIPASLGKRGYFDATTKARGAATVPLGSNTGTHEQLWLNLDDLARRRSLIGASDALQTEDMLRMAFTQYLNGRSAVILSDCDHKDRTTRLQKIAMPFGRSHELFSIDCDDANTSISIAFSAYRTVADTKQTADDLALVGDAFQLAASVLERPLTPALALHLSGMEPLEDLLKGRVSFNGRLVDLAGSDLSNHTLLVSQLSPIQAMSVDERTALSERLSEFFATYAGIACLNRQNPTSLNKVLSQGRTGVLTTSNPHLLSLLAVTLHDADIGQSIPIYIYFANADRLAPTVFQTLADRPFSTFATLRRQNIPKELLEAPIRVTFDAATNGLRLELDLPDIQLTAPLTPFGLDDRPVRPKKTTKKSAP